MNRNQVLSLLLIIAIIGSSVFVYFNVLNPGSEDQPVFKGGTITQDETWSGAIFVNESIVIGYFKEISAKNSFII